MMNALLALAVIAAQAPAAAQADKKEVKWLTKYKEALQIAAKEGKPIVIDSGRKG